MDEKHLSLERNILTDRIVYGIIEQFGSQILEFMVHNANTIVKQVAEDKEYIAGVADCPTVPLFDQYLVGLEVKVKKYVSTNNFPESVVSKVIFRCRTDFYYSALPDILSTSYYH